MVENSDLRILYQLDQNARIPLAELSKKIRMSKQNLVYRLDQLKKKQIINNFTAIIDIHKLGLLSYRVYFRFLKGDDITKNKIINYFSKLSEVIWMVSLSGKWDLEVVFGVKNFIQLNNLLKDVKKSIGQYIQRYDVSMSVVNYHLYRDYLINKKRLDFKYRHYGFEPQEIAIDKLDFLILKELTNDCRQNASQIGEKLKVNYHTIQNRIKKLEKDEIIQGYRVSLDLNKINKEYYKILLKLNNLSEVEEKKLYAFIASYNYVVYLIEVLGGWDLEIECEVDKYTQIDTLIIDVRNKFPNLIIDYETIKITQEHVLNYLPKSNTI